MPQYQGVWTLPVAARLQSNQQWVTDPLFDYTTLLLQADNAPSGAQNNTFLDSSSNNFTITRNGNTTQGTFTPFSQSPGWWSNFFNGSGYLTIPDNAAFDIGASEFSIEAFVYPAASVNTTYIFGQVNASSGNGSYVLWVNGSGYLAFYSSTGGTISTRNDIISSTVLPLNIWSHICVCRSGTTLSLYLNGTRVATQTYSATIFNATNTVAIGADAVGAVPFNGYISGLRYLKGSSAYNATSPTLTVPIAPLTAITNTQLLTCQSNRFVDNSANAFTLTVGGTPSVQAFSPFAPQYQWTAPVIGGSGYFDGTGDYLQIANNTVLTPTGDFTIEFWAYVTDSSGTQEWYSKGYGIQVYIASGVWGTAFSSSNNSTYYVNYATVPVITNAWTHVATTRSGNTYRLFINGVETNSATSSSAPNTGTDVLRLGEWSLGTTFGAKGYMAGVRYLNGTALYTSNFTPPTSPPTAITNTQLLTNFTNAGIYDGTMKNNLETVGNAQISTSVVKYGTGSMAFDGTGDYLTSNAATTDLYAFGSGNFTIEAWVYFNVVNSIQAIYDSRPLSTQGAYPLIYLNSDGTIRYFANGGDQIISSAVLTGVWYHLAIVRLNGVTRMFLNGVQTGSTYTDSTVYINSVGRPWIGLNAFNGTQGLNGYIDDLRVTKGVARYTANFTPPTVALPRQ